ncbi:MAG TPA: hypothetical protein P5228_08585 [Bacteroidales bacterium]|nr:hypothetical protein [Bacteroidales bacterium]HRZ48060.1 hypothetical protein [Bacteroidales bacterium]
MKLIATVEELDEDEIRYLVIEHDKDDSLGYFLFGFKEMEQPCEFDMWFLDLETAMNQALDDYNVQYQEWKDFDIFMKPIRKG